MQRPVTSAIKTQNCFQCELSPFFPKALLYSLLKNINWTSFHYTMRLLLWPVSISWDFHNPKKKKLVDSSDPVIFPWVSPSGWPLHNNCHRGISKPWQSSLVVREYQKITQKCLPTATVKLIFKWFSYFFQSLICFQHDFNILLREG